MLVFVILLNIYTIHAFVGSVFYVNKKLNRYEQGRREGGKDKTQ